MSKLGNSDTPLIKKLGIKEGARLFVKNSPIEYGVLLERIPDRVEVKPGLVNDIDFVHIFTKLRNELSEFLPKAKEAIVPNGVIWVSWPKKSSKVITDVTEDVIREICLPMDLVDTKVCAIDNVWSGLKLVIRKEKRTTI